MWRECVAFTPKGGCPLKPVYQLAHTRIGCGSFVAFTPKGGCPLKRALVGVDYDVHTQTSSIHPQGWVPIETNTTSPATSTSSATGGSIHPQGWVPIETSITAKIVLASFSKAVAFTPKGGCPLKPKIEVKTSGYANGR